MKETQEQSSGERVNPDVAFEREMARKKRLRRKAEKALKELEAANAGLNGKPLNIEIKEEMVEVAETKEGIEIRPEVVESRLEALGIEQKSKPQVEVQPIRARTHELPRKDKHCTARSSRTGLPCKAWCVPGAVVCKTHGGSAPQVKAKARARLENAADLMARELLGIATGAESEAVRLNAVRDALDRGGVQAKTAVSVDVGVRPFEEVFDSIYHGPRAVDTDYSAEKRTALASSDEPVDAELVELEQPTHQPSVHQDDSAPSSRPMYYARMPQMVDAEIVDRSNGLVAFEDAVGQAQRVRPPGPRR